MNIRTISTWLAAGSLWSMSAQAVITVYTDRAAWQAAVGIATQTENFENSTVAPLARGVNQIQTPGSGPRGLVVFVNQSGVGVAEGSAIVNGVTGRALELKTSPLTFSPTQPSIRFPKPVYGFAGDWRGTLDANDLAVWLKPELWLVGGDVQEVRFSDYLSGNGDGFIGVVSDAPFSEVGFFTTTGGLGTNETFTIDNLSYAPTLYSCDFDIWHENGTVQTRFHLAMPVSAAWSVHVVAHSDFYAGTITVPVFATPAIGPPSVGFLNLNGGFAASNRGEVGVLSVLSNFEQGTVCSKYKVVDTGIVDASRGRLETDQLGAALRLTLKTDNTTPRLPVPRIREP